MEHAGCHAYRVIRGYPNGLFLTRQVHDMAIKARLVQAGAAATIVAAGSIAYVFEGEFLQPYVDPVGVLTACVGSTNDVQLGQIYSEQECTDRFINELRHAESAVNRCTPNIPESIKPPLISFAFNVGNGAYCKSTLAKRANDGDLVGACQELYRWVYAGGQVLPGLVKRREAEASSCLNGLL